MADANSLKRELAPYPQQLQVHISGKLENGERVVAGLFRGRPIRSCVDVKIKRGMVYCQLLLLFSVDKASKALVRLFADDFGTRHPNLKLAGLRPLKGLKRRWTSPKLHTTCTFSLMAQLKVIQRPSF